LFKFIKKKPEDVDNLQTAQLNVLPFQNCESVTNKANSNGNQRTVNKISPQEMFLFHENVKSFHKN
jgi:hypothetical protein